MIRFYFLHSTVIYSSNFSIRKIYKIGLETESILDDDDNIDGNIDDDGSFGNDGEVVGDEDISDGANFSKNFSAMTSSFQTF